MLEKVENSGIVSGEEVQNTDNGNVEWPSDLQSGFIDLKAELIERQSRGMPNWKSPGPDGLQGYWLTILTSMKERTVQQLTECLQQSSVPVWITKG